MKRSSRTPPSSWHRQEYWAPPISILATSLESTRCRKASAPGPLDLDLAHVGDVEHPGVRAHRRVLLADPLVRDRHLPAGERHQLRAELDVLLVERSAPEAQRLRGSPRRGYQRLSSRAPRSGQSRLATPDCRG